MSETGAPPVSREEAPIENIAEGITRFVNDKLGTSVHPEIEIEPNPEALEYVAIRFPGEEKISIHPKFFPSDEPGQKTVLLHEISEIAFDQKGAEMPHNLASKLTWENWEQIDGKSPEDIHSELKEKGYYHA